MMFVREPAYKTETFPLGAAVGVEDVVVVVDPQALTMTSTKSEIIIGNKERLRRFAECDMLRPPILPLNTYTLSIAAKGHVVKGSRFHKSRVAP